ncbi:T7SS effector LXG polymorphic toxin [Enterococcus sp. LJL51]|uniref:T7SS effector LXG polymorphic toxin n=1 Tax=Enterococcus sp. LJL51 TaxID=3416656 RepID=UPI003CF89888
MSIDMYLGASQTQADSTKTMCHEAQQGLETLQSGIKDFVGDQVLSGKTYRTAKSYFEAVYVPLIQGAILVSEATAEAVSKIPEQYRADVANVDLKSSELEEEIEKWEQQIQAMEHQIVEVKRVLPVSSERVQHINEINNVITSYQEIKRMLEKKLQKLLTFHAFSSMLFTEVNALKAAVNTGLAQIKSGSAYNAEYGVFDMSRMNMDWATTIAEKAADWRKRKLKEEGMDLDEKLKTRRYVQVDLYGMKSWMWLENPPYISADDYKVNEAYREWAEKEFDLYGREIKRGNDIDEMSRLAIELREGVDYDTGRPLTDVEKAQRWSIVLSSIAQVSIAAYYAGHPLTVDEVVLKDKKVSGFGKKLDVNIKKFEIKNKHLNSSTAKRARKFNVSSAEEANKIVQNALKNGKLVETIPNGVGSQGQNSFSSIIDTGKVIGTKGETHIKIVYDELKNVWTTYPVPKP